MTARAARFAVDRAARYALAFIALLSLPGFAVAQLPADVPSLAPMIERVSPAVVNISISGRLQLSNPLADDPVFRRFLPERGDRPVQSSGSGVIADAARGYVLTNHHVVASAERITVTLFDGRSMEAEVVGTDEQSDIAVLKIAPDNLSQIELGNSDRVRVGDYVVAIGNPFGLSHTVTSGIVSGLGRSNISLDSTAYESFIQTDASINPGNSGGALVGLNGELLGINSAILSRSGGNIGIGFAIPVNMARYVMSELVDTGAVRRGSLGVRIGSITSAVAAERGLTSTRGAVVTDVGPGTAAAKAGMLVNDVIIAVGDRPVHDPGSLRAVIGLNPPGERVAIKIIRDGAEQMLEATLGSAEETARLFDPRTRPEPVFEGVELMAAGGAGEASGLLVTRVDPGSPAAQRGLRSGDLITHINELEVGTIADAATIVRNADSVVLDVLRGRRTLSIEMR